MKPLKTFQLNCIIRQLIMIKGIRKKAYTEQTTYVCDVHAQVLFEQFGNYLKLVAFTING